MSQALVSPVALQVAGPVSKALSGAGVGTTMLFQNDLQTTLVPQLAKGSATATFTRGSGAAVGTVTDFEGLVKQSLEDEARFLGARRVENFLSPSEDITNWSTTSATIADFQTLELTADVNSRMTASYYPTVDGVTYTMSCEVKCLSGTEQFRLRIGNNAGLTNDLTCTTEWQRFSHTFAADGTAGCQVQNALDAAARTINIRNVQLEEVSGQANQNPSEYVSTGVESAPYHGANVDGVQYFDTLNGNTVASNVVTEATGVLIGPNDFYADASGPFGYVSESAATNLLTYSEDFSDTAWARGSIDSPVQEGVAPDGTANSWRIRPTSGSATHFARQLFTSVDTTVYTQGVYVKPNGYDFVQLTGSTGFAAKWVNFNLSTGAVGESGGGTMVGSGIQSVGNGWYRVWVTDTATSSNAAANILICVLDADTASRNPTYTADGASSCLMFGAQLETSSFPSTYIKTEASTVTRAADALTYDNVDNVQNAAGTAYAEASTFWSAAISGIQALIVSGSSGRFLYGQAAHDPTKISVWDNASTSLSPTGTTMNGTPIACASTWGDAMTAYYGGTPDASPASYDGGFGSADFGVGCRNNGAEQWNGTIRNVLIHNIEAAGFGPTITVQPATNASVQEPAAASFSVVATTSGGGMHYQWFNAGVPVGTDAPLYTIDPTDFLQNGNVITVLVTDNNGSELSDGVAVMTISALEMFGVALQTTLVPEIAGGDDTATFTRGSGAAVGTVTDFEGLVNQSLEDEARFLGARRVENYLQDNFGSYLTGGAASISAGGTVTFIDASGQNCYGRTTVPQSGQMFLGSYDIRANSPTDVGKQVSTFIQGDGSDYNTGPAVTLTLTADWQRVATNIGDATSSTWDKARIVWTPVSDLAVVFDLQNVQGERVTGQANQNPSEYVSVGVESTPYHGANVDGVKYFDTLNGNTVASNIVTEATGAAITQTSVQYGRLTGTAGDYFSTPDSVAGSITGDIDIRVKVAMDDWTPSDRQVLASKYLTSTDNRSYMFTIESTLPGKMRLFISEDGDVNDSAVCSSATGFVNGRTHWVRATWSNADNEVNFYKSEDGNNWTQVGTADVELTQTGIFDGTSDVEIGSQSAGVNALAGHIHRALIYDTIDGTTPNVDFNPTEYSTGSTWVADTGETWTIEGNASIFDSPTVDADGPFGYVSESAATNELWYSEELDNAYWSKDSSTITADNVAAPSGETIGDTLVATNPGGSGEVKFRRAVTVTTAVAHTLSIYAKSGTMDKCWLRTILFDAGGDGRTWFDLDLGVVETQQAGHTDAGIDAVGNGWYRCWVVFTTTTDVAGQVQFAAATTDNNVNVPLDGASSVNFWGASLEQSSFPTTYIKTEGSTVTRAADALTYDDTSNIEDAAGTAYAEASTFWGASPGTAGALGRGPNIGSGTLLYLNNGATPTSIRTYDGTTVSQSPLGGTTAQNSAQSLSTTWGAALTAYWNGDPDASPAAYDGAINTGDIRVGHTGLTSESWNGTIRNVKIYDDEGS